jgi:hypothetical protein
VLYEVLKSFLKVGCIEVEFGAIDGFRKEIETRIASDVRCFLYPGNLVAERV